MPGVISDQWHFAFHQLLDVRHELALVGFVYKRPSDTRRSGPTRSTNAMNIGFGDVGDLEVDYVAHTTDVDSTRSDVRCDKNIEFPFAETLHGSFALWLGLVPVNGRSIEVVFSQIAHHLVRAIFRSHEYQSGFYFRLLEQVHEQVSLVCLHHKHHLLINRFGSGALTSHFDPNGIAQHRVGEFQNVGRHGR